MAKQPTLSVVIPFYNEEDNVESTIKSTVVALSHSRVSYEIIAVDNGSRDSTATVLQRLRKKNRCIKICTVVNNLGYGYGVLQGLKQTIGTYVGHMWGDGQVDPSCLPTLLRCLKDSGSDLTKVTRTKRPGYGFLRITESLVYNTLFFLLFGVRSRDINGCPKLMTRECYESLYLQSIDWFLDAEIMIKMKQQRRRFLEIPVIFKKRKGGTSHIRLSAVYEFIANMLKARVGLLWKTQNV